MPSLDGFSTVVLNQGVGLTQKVVEKKSSLKPLNEESNLAKLIGKIAFTGDLARGGRKVKTCYDLMQYETRV